MWSHGSSRAAQTNLCLFNSDWILRWWPKSSYHLQRHSNSFHSASRSHFLPLREAISLDSRICGWHIPGAWCQLMGHSSSETLKGIHLGDLLRNVQLGDSTFQTTVFSTRVIKTHQWLYCFYYERIHSIKRRFQDALWVILESGEHFLYQSWSYLKTNLSSWKLWLWWFLRGDLYCVTVHGTILVPQFFWFIWEEIVKDICYGFLDK